MDQPITNQASLIYNNQSTTSNIVYTNVLSPYSMIATKTPLVNTYTPNNQITYITRIENNGSSSIYNLSVVDDLGNGSLNYVDNSAHAYMNGTPINVTVTSSTNTITFNITNILNPNDNVLIIFEVNPTSNTSTITNTQTITGNGGSTNGTLITVSPSPSATVNIESYARLEITKTASSQSIYPGDDLNYTFVLTNSGNIPATNVTFTDDFMNNYTINTITLTSNGTTTTYSPSSYYTNNTLTIPNLTIPVGTSTLVVNGKVESRPA